MVKKSTASAGETGLIPGLGRSHMCGNNYAPVPQLLSLCPGAGELQRLSLNALEHAAECEAHTAQLE